MPPDITSDMDAATQNAECKTFNGLSYAETLREVKKRLLAFAEQLYRLNLLGAELDENDPPPVGLPIPGFQLNPGEAFGYTLPCSLELTCASNAPQTAASCRC